LRAILQLLSHHGAELMTAHDLDRAVRDLRRTWRS